MKDENHIGIEDVERKSESNASAADICQNNEKLIELQDAIASAAVMPANSVLHAISVNPFNSIDYEVFSKIGNAAIACDYYSDTLSSLGLALSQISESYMASTMTTLQHLSQSIEDMMTSYTCSISDAVRSISASMQSLAFQIAQYDISRIEAVLKEIAFTFDPDEYEKRYYTTMMESRWFPYAVHRVNLSLLIDINEIVSCTYRSKNRIKRIDECIFSFYGRTEIESMRKSWRNTSVPSYILRILNQAVSAYWRKEYAITVIALVCLWEGLVSEKAANTEYRTDKKTKENFAFLIERNKLPQIIADYFNDFIMYDCRSLADLKEDAPGRHGIAHGWWNQYPTKKVALNAILFTDFLLNLHPVEAEEQ